MTDIITGFINIRLLDIIDILLVALLLYGLYNLLKGTTAISIFIGIISIYVLYYLTKRFEMTLLSEILEQFVSVGVIALIIVFQPEIRKFLLIIGKQRFFKQFTKRFFFKKLLLNRMTETNINNLMKACINMSETKTGALIVLANNNTLDDYISTGEILDANLSNHLLENIFFKNSPLHDGAVIIADDKVKAARCILPLTQNNKFPVSYGLRHRAAVGITELTDCIAIIVSEETGEIAYSKSGQLLTKRKAESIISMLKKEFV